MKMFALGHSLDLKLKRKRTMKSYQWTVDVSRHCKEVNKTVCWAIIQHEVYRRLPEMVAWRRRNVKIYRMPELQHAPLCNTVEAANKKILLVSQFFYGNSTFLAKLKKKFALNNSVLLIFSFDNIPRSVSHLFQYERTSQTAQRWSSKIQIPLT
jgi:hypothetical protein